MGRNRTPTAVLEMRGAFVKHPERRKARANEPRPLGTIGEPPQHLSSEQSGAWRELVLHSAPGVLKNCDRFFLEVTASLLADLRAGKLGARGVTQLIACLSKLGMTPADRSKVQAEPERVASEFDLLDNEFKQPPRRKVYGA